MRLIADIGGTHARFALADSTGDLHHMRKLKTGAHDSFAAAAHRYIRTIADTDITSAAIAMAGPVRDGAGRLVNGTWQISEAAISALIDGHNVRLLNDLQAAALGTPHCVAIPLEADRYVDHAQPVLVIGLGTGVGGCLLVPDRSGNTTPVATEIGHGLLSTVGILATDQPFSAEALLSGTGLPTLCQMVGQGAPRRTTPAIIEMLQGGDGAAAELAETYARLLARFAATAALTTGASGGIMLVGGMTERLLPLLPTATLLSAFRLPGPMEHWLRAVTINRVADDTIALKGLAMMPLA